MPFEIPGNASPMPHTRMHITKGLLIKDFVIDKGVVELPACHISNLLAQVFSVGV